MSVRLSCPSCNTGFALDAIPGDRRATCPRCGDVFPVRGEVAEASGGREPPVLSNDVLSNEQGAHAPRSPKSGLSMARTILLALSLGLVGLTVGLIVYFTRDKPTQPEPEPIASKTDATPPAQLAGLGYLPAECNVVFAVQPGPLIAHAERTKQDPRELLTKTGMPKQVLDVIDGLGIPLQQIDHLAAGAFLGNKNDEEIRFAFVFVLKQPIANEEEFLKKLATKPHAKKKAYLRINSEKLPLLQLLTRVSPTVWVFGLSEGDFSAVDRGGFGPGGTQFRGSDSEGVRKMVASVPPDAAVWMLADDDRDWTQKPVMAFMPKGGKNSFPVVKEGRGGLLAIRFGEQPRMRLFVRTVDEATADRVRTYFKTRAAEMESATSGGGGTFAMFDAPFDPTTTWPMLQRFLEDARK